MGNRLMAGPSWSTKPSRSLLAKIEGDMAVAGVATEEAAEAEDIEGVEEDMAAEAEEVDMAVADDVMIAEAAVADTGVDGIVTATTAGEEIGEGIYVYKQKTTQI